MADGYKKRRGEAAYLLLMEIQDERRYAKHAREALEERRRDVKKEGKRYPSPKERGITQSLKEDKVGAHRKVQALTQEYNRLPEREKAAGRKMFAEERKAARRARAK